MTVLGGLVILGLCFSAHLLQEWWRFEHQPRPLPPALRSAFPVYCDYEAILTDPRPMLRTQDEPVFSDDVLPEGVGATDGAAFAERALAAAYPKLTPAMRSAVLQRRHQETQHG